MIKTSKLYQGIFLCGSLFAGQTIAAPNYQLAGTDLSNGHGVQAGSLFSGLVNPASISAHQELKPDYFAIAPTVGLAIEFGNVDEIFDAIDQLATKIGSDDSDGSGGTGGSSNNDGSIVAIAGKILTENLDLTQASQDNPELGKAVSGVAAEIALAGSLMTLMAEEVYAKADAQLVFRLY